MKLVLLNLHNRLIGGITLDPMGRFAALTDSLGRVILLDVPHRQMLRMWKGMSIYFCVLHVCPTHTLGIRVSRGTVRVAMGRTSATITR